jgi:hypothetical protein
MAEKESYKGYIIQAEPQLLADGMWEIKVHIWRANVRHEDEFRGFPAGNYNLKNRGEAVSSCLAFGKLIIDGRHPTFSVADL